MTQRVLSPEQIEEFYTDVFIEIQTRHFIELAGIKGDDGKVVVDVGGGCGFFAKRLADLTARRVRVIDMDPASVEACGSIGVEGVQGDAVNPPVSGDEDIVCFNLILHHLVGDSEQATMELQRKALAAWRGRARAVFVNEYIYDSRFGNASGRLMFEITKSRLLSWIGRVVSSIVPSLRANTFGVGVRFRAHDEWERLFALAGYDVQARVIGFQETVSLPRRMLLIKSIRKDSFLLRPAA